MIRLATTYPRQAEWVGRMTLGIVLSVAVALIGLIYALASCMGG